ncbi:MAG: hypothetical protein J2P27_03875 [Actinobacteria bacterium]|nr:hypothetical protein [Actinomycetota bacterium]
MRDLSALTPPLLVCAVVIIVIVAFLRHEMRQSRSDQNDGDDDSRTAAGEKNTDGTDSNAHGQADVPAADTRDSRSRP